MVVGLAQTGDVGTPGTSLVRGIGVRARISLPLLIPVLGLLALAVDALGLLFDESAKTRRAIRTVLDRLTQQAA